MLLSANYFLTTATKEFFLSNVM